MKTLMKNIYLIRLSKKRTYYIGIDKVRLFELKYIADKSATKIILRKKFSNVRNNANKDKIKRISNIICSRLEKFFILNGNLKIGLYYPIGNEIKTQKLFKQLKINNKIYYPKIIKDDLIFGRVNNLDELVEGQFNILESTRDFIDPKDLDFVIVPGLCFNYLNGARIGYGKGYYDRAFKDTRVKKIGVCAKDHLTHKIPLEDHDVAMDYIITQERTYINTNGSQ